MTPQMMAEQTAKVRRETIRWQILVCLHVAAPEGQTVDHLKMVVCASYSDATGHEIQRHMDYLHERELIEVFTDSFGLQSAKLARYGYDVVEYTVACDAGIARPRKQV